MHNKTIRYRIIGGMCCTV